MPNPTACLLVIGNEILSGRTQDVNIKFLATRLGELGIPLRQVRVIPDVAETIISTVNEVRAAFDHVFTTGGIGPTHDDITAECISAAFGVPWEINDEAFAIMNARYPKGEFNAARQRMATMPRGATLIENPVSAAPGFTIGNVHVMAGVPRIMQSMFECLAPTLKGGAPVISRAVYAIGLLEGAIAADLGGGAEASPAAGRRQLPLRAADRERGRDRQQRHRRGGGGSGNGGGDRDHGAPRADADPG